MRHRSQPFRLAFPLVLSAAALLSSGCSGAGSDTSSTPAEGDGAAPDAATQDTLQPDGPTADAQPDGQPDVEVDAQPDGQLEDAQPDTLPDVEADAQPDGQLGDAQQQDVQVDATEDGALDAGTADGSVTCSPGLFDAAEVDGAVLGMPTVDVPVLPEVVTPQPVRTPAGDHFRKQIGVLCLSPTVPDIRAIEHMLRPMGLPYAVTTSPKLSIQHDLVVFFPETYPQNFVGTELASIQTYLQNQGVLVMKVPEVPELRTMAGVAGSTFGNVHTWVKLTDAGKAEFPSLDAPEEQEIPLGGDATEWLNTWEINLAAGSTAQVLAEFEDGTAAIVKNAYATGFVYAFGVDFRDVVLRAQLGHSLYAARGYINLFEPAGDVWPLMLRDIYDARVPFAARLRSAPQGKDAALLLSHDLDWGPSVTHAVQYAQEEAGRGTSASYFLQTKYVTDAQDIAFFLPELAPSVDQIHALGGILGTHTVAHSPMLSDFPIGDGTEVYPSYQPYNVTPQQTINGTLFGELRVSKSLVSGMMSTCSLPPDVVSFRAGELSYHMQSPETMERLGYRFDSTRAIGDVISNFPYRLMKDWPDESDTSVFEFPVTIEDELSPRIDQRVQATLDVIEANARNGAPTTILIHPNVTDYKLDAERQLLDGLPDSVVPMALEQYAKFWRARDAVRFTAVDHDSTKNTLTFTLLGEEAIDGLTVQLSATVLAVTQPPGASVVSLAPGKSMVVLPPLVAGTPMTVIVTCAP